MARSNTWPNPRTTPAKQLKSNTKKSPQRGSRPTEGGHLGPADKYPLQPRPCGGIFFEPGAAALPIAVTFTQAEGLARQVRKTSSRSRG